MDMSGYIIHFCYCLFILGAGIFSFISWIVKLNKKYKHRDDSIYKIKYKNRDWRRISHRTKQRNKCRNRRREEPDRKIKDYAGCVITSIIIELVISLFTYNYFLDIPYAINGDYEKTTGYVTESYRGRRGAPAITILDGIEFKGYISANKDKRRTLMYLPHTKWIINYY